jgi:hypothetical protein
MNTDTFVPSLADCASGKLNGQILHCAGHSRSMSYAACLARLKAIDEKEQGIPADWSECGQHRRSGQCQASKMRDEELTACKPLYFLKRGALSTGFMALASKAASGWKKGELTVVAARPGVGKSSFLDHIAKTDYAAAINAASPTGTAPLAPVLKPSIPVAFAPPIQALPGESPLQMARRIAAERAAAQQPTNP